MAVTATATVREIVTDALLKIGVTPIGQPPVAAESDLARRTLSRMLKAWQTEGHPVYLRALLQPALTTAASYTLTPARPLRILSVRLKTGGLESPMAELTRDEYDALPDKDATGRPSTWYYDRQREAALLYIWPVLSVRDDETLEITYEREIDDHASLSDTVDAPMEWHEAIIYGLADRLSSDFPTDPMRTAKIKAEAELARRRAIGSDAEASVMFEAADG